MQYVAWTSFGADSVDDITSAQKRTSSSSASERRRVQFCKRCKRSSCCGKTCDGLPVFNQYGPLSIHRYPSLTCEVRRRSAAPRSNQSNFQCISCSMGVKNVNLTGEHGLRVLLTRYLLVTYRHSRSLMTSKTHSGTSRRRQVRPVWHVTLRHVRKGERLEVTSNSTKKRRAEWVSAEYQYMYMYVRTFTIKPRENGMVELCAYE